MIPPSRSPRWLEAYVPLRGGWVGHGEWAVSELPGVPATRRRPGDTRAAPANASAHTSASCPDTAAVGAQRPPTLTR